MKVNYEGTVYDFDLEEVTLKQMDVVQSATGLNLGGLQAGLADGDNNSLRALYWLMLVTSGHKADINNLDFKILKFAQAMQTASEEENAKLAEEAAKKPARGRKTEELKSL